MAEKKGKPSAFTRALGSAPANPPPTPPKPSTAPASTWLPPAASSRAGPVVLRDQARARFAYARVAAVPESERKDYENAVLALGADISRVGLLAALAAVQRLEKRGERLLADLAQAAIPGLSAAAGNSLVGKARNLPVEAYMIATRETLALVGWLRRACQATFAEKSSAVAKD